MAEQKNRKKIFEVKYFGLIIGVFVIGLILLISFTTEIINRLEVKIIDTHFNLKNIFVQESIQEGVTIARRNPNISEDILIIGIDFNSLSRFGRWPFPRYRHANLLDSFTRIRNQGERERSIFLDLFFIEPDENAFHDALLLDAIKNNDRTFLETVLDVNPPPSGSEEELNSRHQVLFDTTGEILNVSGPWEEMTTYLGLQPPLKPYGRALAGYGHANFEDDYDEVFRRQGLVSKSSVLLETIKLEDLTPGTPLDHDNFQRFAWMDKNGVLHSVKYPHTEQVLSNLKKEMSSRAVQRAEDTDNDGKPDLYYYTLRKYQEYFIPSITLSLALDYFNKDYNDLEVVIGSHILIPEPEYFNVEKQKWVPYEITLKEPVYAAEDDPENNIKAGDMLEEGEYKVIDEIKIPIDKNGAMLINFMGLPSSASPEGHQTFPVRSYAGYAARVPGPDPSAWPRTKAVENKILMVGAFAEGIADDKKPTPYGLMYGVEIHANALNTILMDKFIQFAPFWLNTLILAGFVLIIAFMSSRMSTIWSLVITVVLIFGYFIATTIIFDNKAYVLNFSAPAVAAFITFLSIVVYRVMTEEKDKRRIRMMFGRYVNPRVVDQILENPPELGGIDKEVTVLFSDIRGFTSLSESMSPQELVNHINRYLTAMTDVILEYDGTLDKYVGDEIMWFFGAPLPQPDHAFLACQCALRQMEELSKINADWPPERRINIGIGVNSGIMTVANVGSPGRMSYTLMGDNVNLGARLEGTNKVYGTNVLLSEYTYGLVKDRVIARELDNIRVKGKNKPVVIYELVDIPEGLDPPAVNGKDR